MKIPITMTFKQGDPSDDLYVERCRRATEAFVKALHPSAKRAKVLKRESGNIVVEVMTDTSRQRGATEGRVNP